MATPHIAGAMALLWCAQPQLRHDISGSRTVLDNAAHFISSNLCGDPGPPNNVSGWGRVDILAAVAPSPPPFCQPAEVFEYFDGGDAARIASRLGSDKCTRSTAVVGHIKFRGANAAC
jgi:hypothetical protein